MSEKTDRYANVILNIDSHHVPTHAVSTLSCQPRTNLQTAGNEIVLNEGLLHHADELYDIVYIVVYSVN